VRGLAAAGFTVILGARNPAAGEAAASSLDAEPGRVEVVGLDITDDESVDRCIATIAERHGRLDVLVNNGGVNLDRGVAALEADFDAVRATLETNLFGAWRLAVASAELLRASAPARIVNVSSGMGQLEDMQDGAAGYRISKVALNGLTRMLHVALHPHGVAVNSICPGWVRTEMGGEGAYLTVEEGADTILWLATLPFAELPSGGFYKRRERIPW
jgi:NAD(P)-dependent dehydrogenase (short-subunit alcohol dehydrogenase family)